MKKPLVFFLVAVFALLFGVCGACKKKPPTSASSVSTPVPTATSTFTVTSTPTTYYSPTVTPTNTPLYGQGTPQIIPLIVPAMCDGVTNFQGIVAHIDPAQYVLVGYIRGNDLGCIWAWYSKPYWAAPYVSINSDGTWNYPFRTGYNDNLATVMMLYLVPVSKIAQIPVLGEDPCGEDGTMPLVPDSVSVASVWVPRPACTPTPTPSP